MFSLSLSMSLLFLNKDLKFPFLQCLFAWGLIYFMMMLAVDFCSHLLQGLFIHIAIMGMLGCFLDFEHLLIGAWLTLLIILALLAFAKVCAVDSGLEALTVLLLAIALFAVAALKMSLFFITHSQSSEGYRLCRYA